MAKTRLKSTIVDYLVNHGGQSQVFQNPHPTFSYPPRCQQPPNMASLLLRCTVFIGYMDTMDFVFPPMCDFGSKISAKLGFSKTDRDFSTI
nr:MAG TPA: hypothetical protein [Caudoviricetes sp.]